MKDYPASMTTLYILLYNNMGVYLWVDQPPYLCFTANTAGSVVKIHKVKAPANVTLEFSTDGSTRSTYTFSDTISLTNIGDKVYFRNTSETDTQFSIDDENYYHFEMSGSVSGSGDITYLLCKNGTDTIQGNYCFCNLFFYNTSLTSAPSLPATTLTWYCYYSMFNGCTNLTTLPALPATTLQYYCYGQMFNGCSNIKLSETQTGEYQTPYRIPTEGTGTDSSELALDSMFSNTGGTFARSASVNTTYYTSNTIIS